jgi:hypothetical protein
LLGVSLQAHEATSETLRVRLLGLSDFWTARQAWDGQLELLYGTSADSAACRQQLQELQAAGHGLMDAA